MDGNYLLTMQGRNGIRIWVHDGKYRIQRRKELSDKSGKIQDVWLSHTENGQVKLFEKWQEAEQYIHANNIT